MRSSHGDRDISSARLWSGGGPLVVGLVPPPDAAVVSSAARMAIELDRQIVFAYVERNSTLIEQEQPGLRLRMSLDPPIDDEMAALAEGASRVSQRSHGA